MLLLLVLLVVLLFPQFSRAKDDAKKEQAVEPVFSKMMSGHKPGGFFLL